MKRAETANPVRHMASRVRIRHIRIGFDGVVRDLNYADSHQSLAPFGMKWGRGILVRGKGYIEAVTGQYVISHSTLKTDMQEGETSAGAFYYGYSAADKSLYLEYASDRNFDFHDGEILDAIMNALRTESGPLRNFILEST